MTQNLYSRHGRWFQLTLNADGKFILSRNGYALCSFDTQLEAINYVAAFLEDN